VDLGMNSVVWDQLGERRGRVGLPQVGRGGVSVD